MVGMLYVKYGKNWLHSFRGSRLKMLTDDGQTDSLYCKLTHELIGSGELIKETNNNLYMYICILTILSCQVFILKQYHR